MSYNYTKRKRIKVLFITNYPAPYRVDFFNEFGKLCDLDVLFEERPEAQTHRSREWFHTNYDFFNAIFLTQTISCNGHCKLSLDILHYLSKDKYDIIIVGMYSTPTAILSILHMQARGIPYWISSDGGMAKNGRGFSEKLKRLLLGKAVGYFSPSKVTDDYLTFYGADKSRIYRYPFTSLYKKEVFETPISDKEKQALRKKMAVTHRHVIVSVGQFIPRKGFDILIDAASKAKSDIEYFLIGGEAKEDYLSQRDKMNLTDRVHFIPFKNKEKLSEYYKMSDVFVLPTREDIWGLVVNEAMACGLPIITTDKCVAGVELIRSGMNGMIISSNDSQQLAKAIDEMLNEDLSTFSKNSINAIKQYTFENMALVHAEILKEHQRNMR